MLEIGARFFKDSAILFFMQGLWFIGSAKISKFTWGYYEEPGYSSICPSGTISSLLLYKFFLVLMCLLILFWSWIRRESLPLDSSYSKAYPSRLLVIAGSSTAITALMKFPYGSFYIRLGAPTSFKSYLLILLTVLTTFLNAGGSNPLVSEKAACLLDNLSNMSKDLS